MRVEALRAHSRADLARLAADLPGPTADALVGWRFRGTTLGLPRWVERVSWQTFAKDVVDSAAGPVGWNVRCAQTGLTGPLVPRTRRGGEVTFGHFRLRSGPRGAWIDYGWAHDPLRRLDDDRLLGWTVVAGFDTPTWFLLERAHPLPR